MKKFMEWFAVSPVAQALETAVAALLGYLVAHANDFNPMIAVVITAAVPVLIDALNDQDVRFGKIDAEFFEEV